jgi:large exoprotein involved in heme utilization and adhesion
VGLSSGGRLLTTTSSSGRAGDIAVNTPDLQLSGASSGLFAETTSEANGGDLKIQPLGNGQSVRVNLQDGAQISAEPGAVGRGGDIDITAASLSLVNGSQLTAATAGEGTAGNITVSADTVGLSSGGRLLTTTSSSGRAGDIAVNTPDLQLSGASSGLFAETTSEANGGDLKIQPLGNGQSVRVNLQDGAQISASTSSSGNGGELTITAPESITLIGNGSVIAAETGGSGMSGNLNLKTGTLNIQNQAQVTVSSSGVGSAGNLFVDANQIYLNNQGRIRADTSGGGGDINLRSPLILLRNGSSITTNANGSNILGGNININTDNLVAVPSENGDISANSANFRGGNVTITASGIFGIEFREQLTPLSDITATGVSSEFRGTVDIITPGIDPARGLAELPTEVVDASDLIATGCRGVQGSSFVVTGRGGLPPTPQQSLGDDPRWRDWRTPAGVSRQPNAPGIGTLPSSANPPSTKSAQVEATGWVFGADGKVILTASAPNVTSPNRWGQPVNCDGS